MTDWRASGPAQPGGPGLWVQPATSGARLGAWAIDIVLLGFLSLVPLVIEFVIGGLAVNPEAARQLELDPAAMPTVPYFTVNAGPYAAAAVLWVALAVAYPWLCWALAGATPGQRARSLWVVDVRTRQRLSGPRSLLRAALVAGIPAAAYTVAAYAFVQIMAVVPASDMRDAARLNAADVEGWSNLLTVATGIGTVWCVLLLASAAIRGDRRALHDIATGSVVLLVRLPRYGAGAAAWWPAVPVPPAFAVPPVGADPDRPAPGPVDEGTGVATGADGASSPAPPWTGLAGQPDAPRAEPPEAPAEVDGAAAGGSGTVRDATPRPSAGRGAETTDTGRTGPLGSKLPEGLRVAQLRRRVSAYSLDIFLLFVAYNLIDQIIAPATGSGEVPPERLRMLAGLLGAAAQLVYFAGGWWLFRGSLGQRIAGLKVVADPSLKRIGPIDAIVRWAVLQGPFALLFASPDVLATALLLVTFGWAFVLGRSAQDDPDARGYHDRIAGSMVVERAAIRY